MSEVKGLAEFERKLESLGQKEIHERLFRDSKPQLAGTIIRQAKAGIGPDDKPYDEYSESYLKQLSGEESGGDFKRYTARKFLKKGGRSTKRTYKPFLVSIKQKPHMLNPYLFSFDVETDGQGVVGWDGVDDQMNIYAKVHQGKEYGGKNHTKFKGRIWPRPWLHFANTKSRAVLDRAYKNAIASLISDFNQSNL